MMPRKAHAFGSSRTLHPIDRTWFAWILVGFAAYYVLAYLGSDVSPSGDPNQQVGWLLWFDQGEYLKSAVALAHGQFDQSLHTYPPLYSAMAALVIGLLPGHPFFPIDLIAFVVFAGVLLWICGRIYGLRTALIGLIGILLVAPQVTIHQWVVPWTTTMSALLISLQLIAAWHFQVKATPWRLSSRADWLCAALFFIAFSDLAATRPLDFVAFLPFAAFVFVRLEIAAWLGNAPAERMIALLRILLFCAAMCALCAALLIAFNLKVYGHITSEYVWRSAEGYAIADIPEKLYSIFIHSGSVYSETGDALFERFPVFAVVFAVALAALVTGRPFVKGVVLIGLFQILLYLPFPDLMPTSLFRFGLNHYFKWILIWYTVIAFGELVSWLLLPLSFRSRLRRSVALAAILLVFARITLVPVNRAEVEGRRDIAAGTLDIGPVSADQVSYIDIPALAGSFEAIYFNDNKLSLNGTPLAMVYDYRFIPFGDGARLVFMRPQTVKDIHIVFDTNVKVGVSEPKLTLVGLTAGFGG